MAASTPSNFTDSDVLSLPLTRLRSHYDVVVIGSGYGGAIAACRLAQARAGDRPLSVCVLERGRELHAGQYPSNTSGFLDEAQFTTDSAILGREDGLFDFRVSGDVAVILGCGLGGTSLINAGVAIEPEDWVLQDSAWPKAFRGDVERFRAGVRKARHMLGSTVYPATAKVPGKLKALRKSALAMGAECVTAQVNVSFDAHVNPAGVAMGACTLCGDCVTGCNHGAKNTTLRNYLPLARNHGAELFTQVSVRHLERREDRWIVHFEPVGTGRDLFTSELGFVTADLVVLGAGTMGSTEILLRSKAAGLPLSDRVGEGFSGNGDVLAFGYNTDVRIDAIGTGSDPVDPGNPPGPCISGIIDLRRSEATPELGMVLQDGVLPAAFAPAMPALLELAATTGGTDSDAGFLDKLRELAREAESLVAGPRTGAIANTQTYLVMTHDDATGRLEVSGPRAHVTWPGAGDAEYLQRVDQRLQEATHALGGTHIPDPVWVPWLNNKLISCHPLGGCSMAEDASRGVVDDRGRVFSSTQGTGVHPGLYVCDGSTVPRALGVNPLLTISGVAERAMELLLLDHGWTVATDTPAAPVLARPKLGMRFTERMAGTIGLGETDAFDPQAFGAHVQAIDVALVVLVESDDLDEVLDSPRHTAPLTGTVTAPGLHPEPLQIEAGQFALFPQDPTQANTRLMRYRFRAVSQDGGQWWFDGVKIVRDDPGLDLWSDTTTLFTTVHAGPDSQGPVVGKGILKVHVWDLTKSMWTLEVLNAPSLAVKLAAAGRCAKYFFGSLAEVYGGLGRSGAWGTRTSPRPRRPLQLPVAQVLEFTTSDELTLPLTRYPGGTRGPVLLLHDLGASSRQFCADTQDVTLVEALAARGYDVWLLDARWSSDLQGPREATGDHTATIDLPEAVARIRAETGSDAIQAVGHGFGGSVLLSALLRGMPGVRSAVLSQAGVCHEVTVGAHLQAGLHLPGVLKTLGVDRLSARDDDEPGWSDKLFDLALRLLPEPKQETCGSPVCHRLAFLYGRPFDHANLDDATHAALGEWFGEAPIAALAHVSALARAGRLVDASGNDDDLADLAPLAMPLRFVHGASNQVILPASAEESVDLLRATHDPDGALGLYSAVIVPGYGHTDCLMGRHASRDVFPAILEHLDAT